MVSVRLCRFNQSRLGVVDAQRVYDVTDVLAELEPERWPGSWGDPLVANLPWLIPRIEAASMNAPWHNLNEISLQSPVVRPSKVIAAPVNYAKHLEESRADQEINFGTDVKGIDHYGLFLKASTSVVGADDGVTLRFEERRNDHEIELVAVVGSVADSVAREEALRYIAGYCIGLDMTVRGTEDRSFRKSIDSYTVIGPWLVTADEVPNPDELALELRVNGDLRQKANTSDLVFDTRRLIEYASSFYTLYPGDLIMTGTPEGVGPVSAGDSVTATIERIGTMTTAVRQRAK